MFKELIDAIKAGYDAQEITIDDGTYTTKPVYVPPAEPAVEPIQVSTLSGFVDYVVANADDFRTSQATEDEPATFAGHIRIVSSTQAVFEGILYGRHEQRNCYIIADCSGIATNGYPYRRYIPQDEAVIGLQAHFADEGDRATLLAEIGTLLYESSLEVQDDGTTQKTMQRQGIQRRQEGTTKSVVTLTPYRTFADVPQPSSQYVYRVEKSDRGNVINVALFPSGDGQWQLDAIHNIRERLTDLLDGTPAEGISILA